MSDVSKTIFRKVKESAGGKLWQVDAIHAGTTRNNRVYTRDELTLAGRGLSYRPININHSESRYLYYDFIEPTRVGSNSTTIADYIPEKNVVSTQFWITNGPQPLYKSENGMLVTTGETIDVNRLIEEGKMKTVSIEQTPYKGETCSCSTAHSCTCQQHGVVLFSIAGLETYLGVEPGDPNAIIKATEAKKEDDGDNPCEDGFKKNADGKCVKADDDDEKPVDDNAAEADYPWDQCISDQKGKGYDDATAKKICGSIKAANELKKGCNCETRKQEIDELLKLELYLLTGKIE